MSCVFLTNGAEVRTHGLGLLNGQVIHCAAEVKQNKMYIFTFSQGFKPTSSSPRTATDLEAGSIADAKDVGKRRAPDCVPCRNGGHGAPV